MTRDVNLFYEHKNGSVLRFHFYVFSRLTSHVSRLTSHVSRLTSHVSRLTSHVSRLTSHVSRLTSHVIILSYINKNSATVEAM
jgi:hypothetical protein